jgi:L-iditol 2-dehydrogenase
MKALLLSEYNKLAITEMPTPQIADDEVLVRVRACGICGSDIHGYDGSTGRRIPPIVMGHEAAGEIAGVGAGVKDYHEGDRVTFDSTVSCGRCDYCKAGQVNLCDNRMVLGVSCGDYRRHGAFAEYVAVPERILYRLPASLPYERAALIEAVSIAVHAVSLKVPAPTDTVLVVGCGMIGLLVVQVLRAKGCTNILAVDIDAGRLAMAEKFGATRTLNGKDPETPATIKTLTHDQGAEVAFEVVGSTETLQTAIRGVRKGGTVVLIGNFKAKVDLPLQEVVTRQISLLGSCASSGEYPECIELLASGAVDVTPLISLQAPLEDGPGLFERLHRGGEGLMKVVLQP